MNSNFRNKDTMDIFNETWKANHNDNVKKAKEKQQEFNKKLYGVDNNINQGQRINNQVNNLREFQRENFRNKFNG